MAQPSHGPQPFFWAGGFEDTFVPQPHPASDRTLDEYVLTDHYAHWREDLDRAASLGLQALRYGIPWYRVNPAPGVFDWSWTDAVIPYAAKTLGLRLILDLVHYGPPLWLQDGFLNPGYPQAVAAYAEAVATRYLDLVRWYTPLNEPLITAEFCGLRGIWPPHRHGDAGFVQVLDAVCTGIQTTTDALRRVDPAFTIAHVEASATYVQGEGALDEEVQHWQARASIAGDLLTGKVTTDHPLASWLAHNGCGAERWARYGEQPYQPDLWGVNYYPEISVHRLERLNTRLQSRSVNAWADELEAVLLRTYSRYRVPLFISETSTHGDDARRGAWLRDSLASVTASRLHGIPVRGYTWWPLIDLVDWSYGPGEHVQGDFVARQGYPPQGLDSAALAAFAHTMGWESVRAHALVDYLRRMGLWRLDPAENGNGLRRTETAVAALLRQEIARGLPAENAS